MIYYIENDELKVGVKTYGAELTSVYDKASGKELLWQGDEKIWGGQSPVLFPVIGRLLEDKYRLDGKEYTMPKHGFFRKREAELYALNDLSLTLLQKNDEETFQCYPFNFEVFVTFTIDKNTLTVTHKVVNTDSRKIYFSLGAHPAFNCEIGDSLVFDENETLETVSIDSDSIRMNETTPVLTDSREIFITEHVFDNDALILSGIKSENITLCHKNSQDKIIFNFGKSPYLGIWAKPGAPYVCIEPWWGINDSRELKSDLSQKDGIQALEPQNTFECKWQAVFCS